MDKLVINGNGPLMGEVRVSGAKNAALPILAASILARSPVILDNLPAVRDVATMCELLQQLGIQVERSNERVQLDAATISSPIAPYELVKTMRASILVLGPLLTRLGFARVSLPGGCAIGSRPVDLHLTALEKMGAEIKLEHGYIEARATRLKGACINFETVTVTGTENIMMAATLARGQTLITNAACEPEVVNLAEMLIGMGARIQGQGTSTILIDGVERLEGTQHRIMADRIEAGTWVCAAAITCGRVRVTNAGPASLTGFLSKITQAGVPVSLGHDAIEIFPHRGLQAVNITTEPFPGFPTDLQAQFMALMTLARGNSQITEAIFENRFMHVPELERLGAEIQIHGRTAEVMGVSHLSGSEVMATDLRAGAALMIAALAADGKSTIDRIYHLDRGYAHIEEKLSILGADAYRINKKRTGKLRELVPRSDQNIA